MGWFSSKKSMPIKFHARGTDLGFDLNSTRIRAATPGETGYRTLLLDDPHPELPLLIHFENAHPILGRDGFRWTRRLPHLLCNDYLPSLGQQRQWSFQRRSWTSEQAIQLFLRELQPYCSQFQTLGWALPAYMSLNQVQDFSQLMQQAKIPPSGTASSPIALLGFYGQRLLHPVSKNLAPVSSLTSTKEGKESVRLNEPNSSKDWIVPLTKNSNSQQGHVLIIDIDGHAMTLALAQLDREKASIKSLSFNSQLSSKIWQDKLLDALSERCIQLCRRDPRDLGGAEQLLADQINDAMERFYFGQKVTISIRGERWYQDLHLTAEDWDQILQQLTRHTVKAIRNCLEQSGIHEPIQAIWLTHEAAKLPGLRKAIHLQVAERTFVGVFSPDSIANAAAFLCQRWNRREIPPIHLDTTIPLLVNGMDAIEKNEKEKAEQSALPKNQSVANPQMNHAKTTNVAGGHDTSIRANRSS